MDPIKNTPSCTARHHCSDKTNSDLSSELRIVVIGEFSSRGNFQIQKAPTRHNDTTNKMPPPTVPGILAISILFLGSFLTFVHAATDTTKLGNNTIERVSVFSSSAVSVCA
jgi:hypothetical protein